MEKGVGRWLVSGFMVILCSGCSTPPSLVESQVESSLINESEQTSIPSSADISQGEKADSATPIFITVNETSTIFREGYPIDTLPWDMEGQETIGQSDDYIGRIVTIARKTSDGEYAYVWIAGLGFGWIESEALKEADFQPTADSEYITLGDSPITSLPGNSEEAVMIGNTSDRIGERVLLAYASADEEYFYATTVTNEGIGWLEKEVLGLVGEEQVGVITAEGFTVDTLILGTLESETVALTSEQIGVYVTLKGSTPDGSYTLLFKDGNVWGWVDTRAIAIRDDILIAEATDYITAGQYSISSQPPGTPASVQLGTTKDVLGANATILYETIDSSSGYAAYFRWIDRQAFGFENGDYIGVIAAGSYSVDTLPWGTPDYETIGYTDSYAGKELLVKGTTQNGLYSLLWMQGSPLGWVDSRAVKPFDVVPVSYSAVISDGGYSIDSLPWVEFGAKELGSTAEYLEETVSISKETVDGAYLYAEWNGEGLGWIDHSAFWK
ncbi:SH3 domain-containing protein [Trichococcus patagoniensis]|uniref:SH3 domain-containing protein n=1 Tax=Trichococcus patagoniensis TaxID=382641 RepID=A0A2T5IA00_9LACT|nr:SH3-like domain-containing protein [Trichococcus patagoniensis]PTQ80637.1 SH3 domain-containing protein [Trichococcus patagoniensis]